MSTGSFEFILTDDMKEHRFWPILQIVLFISDTQDEQNSNHDSTTKITESNHNELGLTSRNLITEAKLIATFVQPHATIWLINLRNIFGTIFPQILRIWWLISKS